MRTRVFPLVIQLVIAVLAVLVAGLFSLGWQYLPPEITQPILARLSKEFLLVVIVFLLLLVVVEIAYIIYLNQKYKLKIVDGIYWDKDQNPHCLACKNPMSKSNYTSHYIEGMPPPELKLMCIKCKSFIKITDKAKELLTE